MSFFGTKSQFFFKLCITLQCHETQLFCTFSSKTVYDLDKRSASKFKFSDFRTLAQKLTKFFMSFYKSRVSFFLNLELPFSVMTIIPLEFYCWNIICFGQKEPIKVQFFNFSKTQLLSALIKVQPISHAIFETTRSGFIQILHHCSVSWK